MVCGRGVFSCGEQELEIRAGTWLKVPAGATLDCQVTTLVSARCHALGLDALSLGPLNTRLQASPATTTGAFQSVATRLPEGSPYQGTIFLSAATIDPYGFHVPGPLFRALFVVPRAALSVSTIWLSDHCRGLDCLYSWGPTGLAHRRGQATVPPVLTRLQATGHPALVGISSLLLHDGDRTTLEALALVLGLERELGHTEELFVTDGAELLRWVPSAAGASLGEALRLFLTAVPPSTTAGPIEPIVEHLLASLWQPGPDSEFYQWMTRPIDVPYRVGFLACSEGHALSPTFRARWQIDAVCPAFESAVQSDYGVAVACVEADGATSRWRVRWHFDHEYVEWEYLVRLDGGQVRSDRTLIEQYD